jgi:hypothetical protein
MSNVISKPKCYALSNEAGMIPKLLQKLYPIHCSMNETRSPFEIASNFDQEMTFWGSRLICLLELSEET